MSQSLANLQPQAVFQHFAQFLNIPHVSGNEQGMIDYLVAFAQEHKLDYRTDSVGNVIIERAATKDSSKTILLQAHTDMVGVCKKGLAFNFATDAIPAYYDDKDGFIKTKGTTLGADNGIGVALALAYLADKDLQAPKIRAIFTVSEETTMKGASNLAASELEGDYLINLDSEEDGFLYVSCAGCMDINIKFERPKSQIDSNAYAFYSLDLSELSGGHSGADIHLGRANAIMLLNRMLSALKHDFMLHSLEAGTARNAIANFAEIKLAFKQDDAEAALADLNKLVNEYKLIYAKTDPNLKFEVKKLSLKDESFYDIASSKYFVAMVSAMPEGVLRSFDEDRSVPETSVNLSLARSVDNTISLSLLSRSLSDRGLDDINNKFEAYLSYRDGVSYSLGNRHFAWSSPSDNELIRMLKAQYQSLLGRELKITAMHAGLECALFAKANQDLQLVSIGPTILNPHSPFEQCYVKGVEEIYAVVKNTLQAL